MIIEAIMNGIYNFLDTILIFNIPSLPTEVYQYIDTAFDYISMGAGVLANYTPLAYLLVLFGIIITVDIAIMGYHLAMWVIKKIPLLGME